MIIDGGPEFYGHMTYGPHSGFEVHHSWSIKSRARVSQFISSPIVDWVGRP